MWNVGVFLLLLLCSCHLATWQLMKCMRRSEAMIWVWSLFLGLFYIMIVIVVFLDTCVFEYCEGL
ncbi:hypothetical protein KC19_3G133300 [Ceratodon purpureus]|uniref:Uncharacterized protein n=1 Tax=Ceratodon purpureus TaxID=3225 RepID=A0A8T0IKB7_CERPU|nr:hypothetical protein KC19_3G133300 [Ceratodon purpureus]